MAEGNGVTATTERGIQRVEARPMELSTTAFEPATLTDLINFAKWAADSQLVPMAFRGKPQDIVLVAIRGRELGFSMMQSLAAFDVIDGRACLNSGAIVAVISTAPDCEYFMLTESTAQKATYETKRRSHPRPISLSWTIEQAKIAGLTEKNTWRKTPDAMLRHRAASALGKAVFPDRLLGLMSREEAEDVSDTERGGPESRAEVPDEIKEDIRAIMANRDVSEITPGDAGVILDDRRELISADNLKEVNDYLRSFCPAKTSAASIRKARAEAEAKRESAASGAKVAVQTTPDGPVQTPPVETPAQTTITVPQRVMTVETPTGSALKAETPAPMIYDGRLAASIVISLDLAPDTKTLNDVWNTSVVSARAEGRLSDPDWTMLEKAYDARMEKIATPIERLNAVLNDFSTAADKADIDAANAAYAALKLTKGSAEDKLCAETSIAARRRLGLPVKSRAPKGDAPVETTAPAPLGTAKEPTLPGVSTAHVVATPEPDPERESIAAESAPADAFGESEPDPFADDAPAEPDPNTGLAAPIDTIAWTARMQNANAKHIINSLAYHWPEFQDGKAAVIAAVGLLAPPDRKPLMGILDAKDARAQLKSAKDAKEQERAAKARATS